MDYEIDYEIDYCDRCGAVIPRGFGYLCEECRDGGWEDEQEEQEDKNIKTPPSYW